MMLLLTERRERVLGTLTVQRTRVIGTLTARRERVLGVAPVPPPEPPPAGGGGGGRTRPWLPPLPAPPTIRLPRTDRARGAAELVLGASVLMHMQAHTTGGGVLKLSAAGRAFLRMHANGHITGRLAGHAHVRLRHADPPDELFVLGLADDT